MTHFWLDTESISVTVDEAERPLRFTWHGRHHPIRHIANRWRIDSRWWDGRIWRDYFKVVSQTGLLAVIYHDLLTDHWYLHRLYD